mgnify:CR=1 FL=1
MNTSSIRSVTKLIDILRGDGRVLEVNPEMRYAFLADRNFHSQERQVTVNITTFDAAMKRGLLVELAKDDKYARFLTQFGLVGYVLSEAEK